MILKKPYAFLIKYFKLINFILSGLAMYIVYRTYNIVNFFNDYILNNYTGNYYEGFYTSYISPFVYLIVVIILIGLLSIFLLFRYKKKPAKLYIFSIIYYILYIIFLVFIKDVMITIESSVITAETARLYRDISVILMMPQLPLVIAYILRGFGFNVKKLNFEQDLKELEIEEKDSEEFEFVLKKDDIKLKRNIHRFFREFKYYVKENKFVFSIICIVVGIALAFLVIQLFPEIIDRNYNQGENFKINNLIYKIEDSIITNLDYSGNLIDKSKYYVVVKMSIENTGSEDVTLDYNNFRLIVNDSYVYPTKDKGKNFIDYANAYYNTEIRANTKDIYSLVYEINEADLKKNYEIKIYNGQTLSDNLLIGKHDYVTIAPIVINKVSTVATVQEGEELSFSNSNLGDTKLTLSNATITERYIYDYEHCINDICNNYKDIVTIDYTHNNTTLIVLDYTYTIDSTVPFYNYSNNIKS